MILYEDSELTTKIGESFTFGIVDVGEVAQKTIWIKNEETRAGKRTGLLKYLEFTVTCHDPENGTLITDEQVDVLEAPEEMQPHEVSAVKLEWAPAVDLEQGLRAKLNIRAKKIVG